MHNGFGRMHTNTQTTGSNPPYGYSQTDALTSMQYPSGRQVTYGLDAADRVTTVQNTAAGGNYAIVGYKASGAMSTMLLGNGATQAFSWNDRVQPTGLAVTGSPSAGSPSLLTLGFFPCASQATTCTSGNNGNVQSQSIAMPGLSVTQNYSYDHLNRLTQAQETGGSGWTQGYGYDTLGNRWVSTNTNLPTLTSETPQSSSWYSSTAPNRITGWSYDLNGNLLGPAGVAKSYTYDAENRQVTANMNGAVSNYSYDGNGLRVGRVTGSQTTIYVYDAEGNLAAEYPTWADGSNCGTPTCYAIEDHLGSTRLLTDSSGSGSVKRYDYQPFGQELLAGIGSRTTAEGYQSAPDGMNPKFTGQQRDADTGLDWYQVRHMSGVQGRFQSVDPANAGADAGDPQTWNGYSYVGNNPLSFVDPSGMFGEAGGDSGTDGVAGLIIAGIEGAFNALFGGGGPPPTIPSSLVTPSSPMLGYSFSPSGGGVGFGADVLDLGVVFTSDVFLLAGKGTGAKAASGAKGASGAPGNFLRMPLPANHQNCTTSSGISFPAPPGFSVSNIAANGAANGLAGAGAAVGQGGYYDYQRLQVGAVTEYFPGYVPVANVAVGAYVQGTGAPQWMASLISNTYAFLKSSNGATAQQAQFRGLGYSLAAGKATYSCHP